MMMSLQTQRAHNAFFSGADNCAKYPLFDVLLGIVSTIFTDKEAKVMKS